MACDSRRYLLPISSTVTVPQVRESGILRDVLSRRDVEEESTDHYAVANAVIVGAESAL